MQAYELRIGNLIKKNNEIIRVNKHTFLNIDNYPEKYEPILLSLDWFDKLGFDKSWHGYENGKSEYTFELENKEYSLLIDGLHTKTKIKFVHQLQNLYFALIGQEVNSF